MTDAPKRRAVPEGYINRIVDDLKDYLRQADAKGPRHFLDDEVVARARSIAASAVPVSPVAQPEEKAADPERAAKAKRAASKFAISKEEARRMGANPEAASQPQLSYEEKERLLNELNETQVSGCTRCKLHKGRTNTVFGVGSPDANVVFVGEAPGRDEDLQGEPFVGAAGQLLNKILSAIGFERKDVYIANVLKCRPPNNRDPEADEVAMCEPYLKRQLDILQPKVICALGRHAASTLMGKPVALGRMRGKVHEYHGIPLVVTYHPAALLRNPQWKRPTWEDVQNLRALHDELIGEA